MNLNTYEEVLALHPDSTLEEQKELYRSSAKVIESFKGTIHTVDNLGSRPLANTGEKKLSRAWYFYMIFSASPGVISELRRKLRINEKIIYFHHEKLNSKQNPEKHRQQFLEVLEKSAHKENERQAKINKKQGGKQ